MRLNTQYRSRHVVQEQELKKLRGNGCAQPSLVGCTGLSVKSETLPNGNLTFPDDNELDTPIQWLRRALLSLRRVA